ncbi:hypothetical protein ABPG74_011746 [Tetrahymena malaccensis]
MEEELSSSAVENYQNSESFKHIDVPNFRQIKDPNFLLPGYQLLQRNSYKPFKSSLSSFNNKKQEGIYIHKVIEEYLKWRIQTQQIESAKWIQKFGSRWIFIVIEKIIFYMQQRGLKNYKVEYVTTNSSLTKRFDVIFHDDNLEKLCVVDWKYSELPFESILKLFQQHFKDQLFEAKKQFNTDNVTLIIVPLKQIHNFTIQEITSEDLFKIVKLISSDLNTLNIKYQQYYNQIRENQQELLLKPSEIGKMSRIKKELLFENISQILKYNSQQQIDYYLNLENLNNHIQPKNKDQYWIIHVFLTEILIKKNEYFKNILIELSNKNSTNQKLPIKQNQIISKPDISYQKLPIQQNQITSKPDISQLKNQIECQSRIEQRGYIISCYDKQEFIRFEV